LDFDIGFREVSGVLVTDRQEDLTAIRKRVTQLKTKGLNAEFLSSDGLRRVEPKLSSHLVGGLFCRESARIYSPRLVVGFARAAQRHGAKIATRTKVLQIRCENGKVREVRTESGVLGAGTVVIAAGTGSKALARTAGIDLPVELFRGELLVTEPTAEIGNHMINELEKADGKAYTNSSHLMHRYQIRLVFSREGDGNCLIGRSSEQMTEDRSLTTWAVVKGLAENVCRFLPLFSNTSIIRAFSGIRVISPDGFPIVGLSRAIEGLYLSVAHADKGVNTGPIIGKLLASHIASGEEPNLLKSFSPERFAGAKSG
jgi:glycine/D-amino acid oxidase-like deaminating enzyme